jgi:GTP:adenosylcobinamide-phosphate guanylyltransferase
MPDEQIAALIMAGGRSERMRAGGCSQHKALRRVLGVPMIYDVLMKASRAYAK